MNAPKARLLFLLLFLVSTAMTACVGNNSSGLNDMTLDADTDMTEEDADTTADTPEDCVAQCDGRVCGDDGCGGSCGSCMGDEVCNTSGQCEIPVQDCTGADNGTACGDTGDSICIDGMCQMSDCGDGYVDEGLGEECDDGNTMEGDGCTPGCTFDCTEMRGCEDGDICNGVLECDLDTHTCVEAEAALDCDDTDPCTDDLCDPVDGCSNPLIDNDMDGHASDQLGACGDDCDDMDADVYTGHAEVCDDGKDNDCNMMVDDAMDNVNWYLDCDGDGFAPTSEIGNPTVMCAQPADQNGCTWTDTDPANSADCDDNDNTSHPNGTEICHNMADEDCSGDVDDAPTCYITCDWNGAQWLSHGWDGPNAYQTGGYFTCTNNRLAEVEWVENAGTALDPNASGTADLLVGCDWGAPNTTRWLSQGGDGGFAFVNGATVTCSSGRVTSMSFESPNVPGTAGSGNLDCNWTGGRYFSHGWDAACAFSQGLVITCNNGKITDFKEVTGPCGWARY